MLKKIVRAVDTCINIIGIAALFSSPVLFVILAFYVLISIE